MPLYEFYCNYCRERFEKLWRTPDLPDVLVCPKCRAFSMRVFSTFSFRFDFPTLDASDIMEDKGKEGYGREVQGN